MCVCVILCCVRVLCCSAVCVCVFPGSQSNQQTSPPSKPSHTQQQQQHRSTATKEERKDSDSFSAALSALEKLDIKSSKEQSTTAKVEEEQLILRESSGEQRRELSPSVAAVFESVEASGGSRASLLPNVPTQPTPSDRDRPSQTLKALLKMEEAEEGERTQKEGEMMPEAIQKLIQPLNPPPRGPLLPHPLYPPHPSLRGPPPPPHLHQLPPSQFYPPPPPPAARGKGTCMQVEMS